MVTNFYYIQYRGMQVRTANRVRLILKLYVNDCLLWKELYFDVHGLKVPQYFVYDSTTMCLRHQ